MKILSMIALVSLFSMVSCSHWNKACCKDKQSCCKEKECSKGADSCHKKTEVESCHKPEQKKS